ncbi:MAG: endonuclease Q family protein [DPANN group archaeon]|nr:endonuclease Q family protein [DPANN group archaeon]
MVINTDLHSHSGYAGGVGTISLENIEKTMTLKGIDIFGTGDCLHPKWNKHLKNILIEKENGLFSLKNSETDKRFLLQTEIIITVDIKNARKIVHTLIFFPSFECVDKVTKCLESYGMKNTVGRPFLKCNNNIDVSNKLEKILNLDDLIEIVPAHIMTPQGVFGSNNPVYSMKEFYGNVSDRFKAVETGLSADPNILNMIPELDNISLISNSDTHSAALNRVGREFTSFDINKPSYDSIINCIRNRKILKTAEFNPEEGKFFLTGHRAGKKDHNDSYCVFSPKNTPPTKICPICNKSLTIGVLEQVKKIFDMQIKNINPEDRTQLKRDFVSTVPLIEIIAYTLGIKTVLSPKINSIYRDIIKTIGDESKLWFNSKSDIQKRLSGVVDDILISNIIQVKDGCFGFSPPGFDGTYGDLVIGKKIDFNNINTIFCNPNQTVNIENNQKKLY